MGRLRMRSAGRKNWVWVGLGWLGFAWLLWVGMGLVAMCRVVSGWDEFYWYTRVMIGLYLISFIMGHINMGLFGLVGLHCVTLGYINFDCFR